MRRNLSAAPDDGGAGSGDGWPPAIQSVERARLDHVPALDGVRFMAALCVLLAHAVAVPRADPNAPLEGMVEFLVSNLAGLGMTLFFILSGFVIHLNYRQTAGLGRGGTARFLIARFARLYPLYILVFGYAFGHLLWALGYFQGHVLTDYNPWKALPLYLTFTQTFWLWPLGPHSGYTYYETPFTGVTGVMWSLSTEWFFYLVYPLFSSAAARLAGRKLLAAGAVTALACITFFFLVRGQDEALGALSEANFPQVPANELFHWLYFNGPYGRFFEFLLGVLGAQVYLTTRPSLATVRLITYVPAVTFACCYFYGCDGTQSALTGWPFSYYAPLITLMILGLMWRQTWLSVFFGSALLIAGGEASYSMYLLHEFVLEYFHDFAFLHPNLPPVFSYIAAVFISIVIARITYLIFERNATRFIRSRFIAYKMHVGIPACLALVIAASFFFSHQMSAIQAAALGP